MDMSNMVSLITVVIMISNMILAGFVVFIERRDVGTTWAWLMILLFIPLLGFIAYILIGRQLKEKNFFNLTAEEEAYLKAAAEKQVKMIPQQRHLKEKYEELFRLNLRSSNALLTTNNEIQIFHDGTEKFNALFNDIRAATREINIQYYIIQRDQLGRRLRDELTKKAKEGVKVRVLYDDIGSRRMTRSFFKELQAHGGEVHVFFPSLLKWVNLRINNRNHRKLCIIDGKTAYIGGFNVGDEYLGMNKKMGYWRDTHLRITGGAVEHIQGRFIMDWNKASNSGKEVRQKFITRSNKHHGQSAIQIISSGPNSQTEHLKNMYLKLMLSAHKSIYIQSPYFIPDGSFMDACKIALLSGVDVRIMIPNKPDHPFVYPATLSYVGELLTYGAKVLQYEKGFLHAKTIVVDQEVASVGTMNIDTRSFRLNFEVNALIYDTKVAQQLQELFIRDSEDCTELTLEKYRTRPIGARIKEAIARLLSPIL